MFQLLFDYCLFYWLVMEVWVFGVVLLGVVWIGLCEGIFYDLFYFYGYQFGDMVLE